MKYLPNNLVVHTSSFGNVNYWHDARTETPDAMAQRVLAEHPGCVIVNGSDDWNAKPERRPERFAHDLGIENVAFFHTGISGISSSGVVLTRTEFEKLVGRYMDTYGKDVRKELRVYE